MSSCESLLTPTVLGIFFDINHHAKPMNTLIQLHADIDARINTIRSHHDWQCKMGCDSCCHRLASIPLLTRMEWKWLCIGLTNLSPDILHDITQAITELSTSSKPLITCPMLDKSQGLCRVYEYRPIACRTYGYYVEHDKGLYCQEILEQVEKGLLQTVIWGNQKGIDRQLKALGERKDLTQWFAEWKRPV